MTEDLNDPYAIDWGAFRESVEGRLHTVVRGELPPATPESKPRMMTITLGPVSTDPYERQRNRALARSRRNSTAGQPRRRHGARR